MRILLTRKRFNIGSLFIRWVVPSSRVRLARASHSIIVDGDHAIEAVMATVRRVDHWFPWRIGGVRRVPLAQALHGAQVVGEKILPLQDEQAGIEFARTQVGKPYDFKGAAGLALKDGEAFHDPRAWFCHELSAAAARAGGFDVFEDDSRITDAILFALKTGAV